MTSENIDLSAGDTLYVYYYANWMKAGGSGGNTASARLSWNYKSRLRFSRWFLKLLKTEADREPARNC
jgi:hypothetical protein